jgi:hypothetical protein
LCKFGFSDVGDLQQEKRQEKAAKQKVSDDEAEKDEEEEEEEEARPQRRGGLARMQVRRRGKPAGSFAPATPSYARVPLLRMLDRSVQLTLLLTCWGSAASVEESDEEDAAARHNESADEDDVADEGVRPEKKIGAKKLAKLQRKEEAKQIRQVLRPILACGLVLKVSVLLTWWSPVCCVVCAALRCFRPRRRGGRSERRGRSRRKRSG